MMNQISARAALFVLMLLPSLLFLDSCTNDPIYSETSVEVSALGLPALKASEGYYELWFSYPDDASDKAARVAHGDAEYVSMGTFLVDDEGVVTGRDGGAATFSVPEGYNSNLLIDAILTVEPVGGSGGDPGGRLLSGEFGGNSSQGIATLKISGSDAFNAGFDSVHLEGSCQLFTPTTFTASDDVQGIWFLDATLQPSLTLRSQPVNLDNPGWTYESWLVRQSGEGPEYISLGTFNNVSALDSDGAGPGAGSDPLEYSAPGQDFVTGNVRTLNDGTYGVLVSLQPEALNLQRPFQSLLELPLIETSAQRNVPMELERALQEMSVEIVVNR